MTPRQALRCAVQVQREQADAAEKRIQAEMTALVQAATDPDASRRHAVVESLLRTCIPAVLGRLSQRLVDLLARGGESAQGRAAASLVQLGARALPALTRKFRQARSAAVQRRVVGVLGELTRSLGPADRCDLALDLIALGPHAAEESVSRDLAEVAALLRRHVESAP
jgi:HEAT repeat protein